MSAASSVFSVFQGQGSVRVAFATFIGTAALLSIFFIYSQRRRKKRIRSPTFTLLPKLSRDERAALDYPPDVLPGGRDAKTPVSASTPCLRE